MNFDDLPRIKPALQSEKQTNSNNEKAKVVNKVKNKKNGKSAAVDAASKIVKKATSKSEKKVEKKSEKILKKATAKATGFVAVVKANGSAPSKPALTDAAQVHQFVVAKAAVAFNKVASAKSLRKSIVDAVKPSLKNAVSSSVKDEHIAGMRELLSSKLSSKVEGIAAKAAKAAGNAKNPLTKDQLSEFVTAAEVVVNDHFSVSAKKENKASKPVVKEAKPSKSDKSEKKEKKAEKKADKSFKKKSVPKKKSK
jgi:hypothetical protein